MCNKGCVESHKPELLTKMGDRNRDISVAFSGILIPDVVERFIRDRYVESTWTINQRDVDGNDRDINVKSMRVTYRLGDISLIGNYINCDHRDFEEFCYNNPNLITGEYIYNEIKGKHVEFRANISLTRYGRIRISDIKVQNSNASYC